MERPKPIPISQFNASQPGRYYVKWVDDDGYAVEGWKTKTDGWRHQGRDPKWDDKGIEWARNHAKTYDYAKRR